MKCTTVGIYARSSISGQTARDLRVLHAFAAAQGWRGNEYVDEGLSGVTHPSPGLADVVAAALAHKIDAVVCTSRDRLARRSEDLAHVTAALKALHVDVIALDELANA